ncbi:MAG TPA: glycosyltransferase [Methanothermobacter sp.]|nr:capsular polysaccharide biosynthesis protein [Methanothermobacter sp. MT-2]HHW05591.1 glycosyltransferase [Methanothermobacter sp.]HOK72691.1 glycosyltransferase [Methanothermobacter sp.]HOL68589.1 glycosyltransferase [Methanothermobacter sp.]HPQ04348.1 glycosyltransferase [Methanothermobacter sp.]
MKIGILLPAVDDSGMAKAASQLSFILEGLSHDVHMITVYGHRPVHEYAGSFHVLDVPPANENQNFIERIILFLKRILALKKIKKDLGLDVAISFSEALNIQNILTMGSEKTIITLHTILSKNEKLEDLYGRMLKLLIKIFYNRASLIVSVSEKAARDLITNFNVKSSRIRIIPNPVQIKVIKKLGGEDLGRYSQIFEDPVIITAGRLTYAKGQWYLLRIFKRLKEKSPKLKLVILGDGELKDYLIEFSEKLGLKTCAGGEITDSDVYFLGFRENPYKFFKSSKFFVLPSLREALPLVILEVMALGVPVIASDCGGTREILAPSTDPNYETREAEFAEYGILLPVFNEEVEIDSELTSVEGKWYTTLKELLEDSRLAYYSIKSRERAEDFSEEKIQKMWREVLD